MFQFGLDYCLVQAKDKPCPYDFMTCKSCPFSANYRQEIYNKNLARGIAYRSFK